MPQVDVVRGSRPIQPLLRKFRQPMYDEEKIGNGAATAAITLFARRRGENDRAAHQKTARDTNLLQNGALGAKQEFYLVGFNIMLDWSILVEDQVTAAPGAANNELYAIKQIMNDSLFQFQFGRQQYLVEIPMERVPFGMSPHGSIDNARVRAATEVSHVISNGVPSAREFYDVRLRKNRPRHIQPEQSFSVEITWPNGAITIGTSSGAEWYRIMVYAVGILLAAL